MCTRRVFTGVILVLVMATSFAADVFAQGTRAQREEIERIMDNAPEQRGSSNPTDAYPMQWSPDELPAQLDVKRDFLWDVGGWVKGTMSTFDTVEGRDRTLRDYDLRFWAKFTYMEHHSFYARGRSFFADYNTGDAPGQRDDDWQALRGDQIFYEGRLARALKWDPNTDLDLTVGRQFFFLGKGAVLSNVFDGVRLDGRYKGSGATVLAARTIQNSPDIDPTVPAVDNESDRLFFGAYAYTMNYLDRRFYAYFLAQLDQNDFSTAGQSYDYDSYYLGLGGDGEIPVPGLNPNELSYSAELMLQFGSSAATGTTTDESIFAYGWLIDINWFPGDRVPWQSRGTFSYYFGSGDGDRGLQLGTLGGNTAGTDDSALNYFGFVNTGFSLAPRLTNLHMLRFNAETSPIVNADYERWTRELKISVSLYAFFKHHSGAAISDFTSVEDDSYVGSEIDLYVDWTVFSDLDVSFRYGAFFPGGAFEFDDVRNFLSFGASFSF